MKLLLCLVFGITVVQALTDEQKKQLRSYGNECRTQTKVTKEVLDKIRVGEFVDDPKLKMHLLCIMKKIGIATESGDIVVEFIRNRLKRGKSNEEVEKIINRCVVKKDTHPEDTAFEIAKCLRESRGGLANFI